MRGTTSSATRRIERYYSIEFEYKTRPLYRKRRWRTETVAIAANATDSRAAAATSALGRRLEKN